MRALAAAAAAATNDRLAATRRTEVRNISVGSEGRQFNAGTYQQDLASTAP